MYLLVQSNVLAVGLSDSDLEHKLPIRVVSVDTAKEAVRSLKIEKFDSVVAAWNLPDMKDGQFHRRLRNAKPDLSVIALVESGNYAEEISARSAGACAVIGMSEKADELLTVILADTLKTDALKPLEQSS